MVLQRHPKIITFNRLGDNESLMNPLKERTATTNAIKTLFICSALLVGFMSMSLGLVKLRRLQHRVLQKVDRQRRHNVRLVVLLTVENVQLLYVHQRLMSSAVMSA